MGKKKEATARIRINDLLSQTGWRFFDDSEGRANICLEMHIKPTKADLDALGENFEGTKSGFADYILLNSRNFPLAVLEAKKEELDPLVGKEQARTYAQRLKARFIILSNGSLHYLWDLLRGNPQLITTFPSQNSLEEYKKTKPDRDKLVNEKVDAAYILVSQDFEYAQR